MPKAKSKIEVVENKELTYRLSLIASDNHSVFIDIELADLENSKDCYTAITPLIEKYAELLKENEAKVALIEKNDVEVETTAKRKQAKKQKELKKQNGKIETTQEDQDSDIDEDTGEFEESDR